MIDTKCRETLDLDLSSYFQTPKSHPILNSYIWNPLSNQTHILATRGHARKFLRYFLVQQSLKYCLTRVEMFSLNLILCCPEVESGGKHRITQLKKLRKVTKWCSRNKNFRFLSLSPNLYHNSYTKSAS